jgi:hypothetical protein
VAATYYEGTSGEKVEQMARTSRRKWTLLPVSLLASLYHYGDSIDPTYYPGINLWQCRTCRRVEEFFEVDHLPQCPGAKGKRHALSRTRKVRQSENLRPAADNEQVFI